MFWIPFYKILQKTKGKITQADPKELEQAVMQNVNKNESPTSAYRYAFEKYVKDPKLEF